MKDLCSGKFSLSPDDIALVDVLQKRGLPGLPGIMDDEEVRRDFWGLANELKWEDALPLANVLLKTFGVREAWSQWKENALKMRLMNA